MSWRSSGPNWAALGFPAYAALSEDPMQERETERRAASAAELRRFALADLSEAVACSDCELVSDVGEFQSFRRNENWTKHEALRADGVSDRGGIDGRIAVVSEAGVVREGDPFAPDHPTVAAVSLLSALDPQYLYRITTDFPIRMILHKHISIDRGYSAQRRSCEFSTAVAGLGGGACATCDSPQPSCCDGNAVGWALDYWEPKNTILVWRACAPCLATVAYWRAHPTAAADASRWVHDPDGTHAAKIDAVNQHKARIAIAQTNKILRNLGRQPHPSRFDGNSDR
jgi:hypothetical protein